MSSTSSPITLIIFSISFSYTPRLLRFFLISEFENLEDLKKYKTDPRHVKVSNMCKEIRTKRTAFDFEE
mgnify:CR=1 FL=1